MHRTKVAKDNIHASVKQNSEFVALWYFSLVYLFRIWKLLQHQYSIHVELYYTLKKNRIYFFTAYWSHIFNLKYFSTHFALLYHVSSFTCHIIPRNSYYIIYISIIIACLVIEDINTSFKENVRVRNVIQLVTTHLKTQWLSVLLKTITCILDIFSIPILKYQGWVMD